ncbi:MAG: phosphodiester glycosidase family protein [Armatimonadetes bacterium]|nr:phosphodiester glycosidase family protein [Armatimonadota bacterium]
MLRRWAAAACLPFLAACGGTTHLAVERRGDQLVVTARLAEQMGAEERHAAADQAPTVVPLPGARAPRQPEVVTLDEPPGRIELRAAPDGSARVELWLDPGYPRRFATADGGVTITVDLVHDEQQTLPLDAGVTWESRLRCRPHRVLRYYSVRLDRAATPRLRVVTAGPKLTDRRPLPELARGATAAINGGYFDPATGNPLGALKVDGEWIRPPLLHRTALFLPRTGRPKIGVPEWAGTFTAAGTTRPLAGLNGRPSDPSQAVLTTSRWPFERSFPGLLATPLPGLHAVLHTRETVGTPLRVRPASKPDVDGSILGAGPRLVAGGQAWVTHVEERFRDDITKTVSARSGAGILPDGGMLLVYVDGRGGMRLEEFAAIMAELGCESALNLDGNTSSTMVVGGALVGLPLEQVGHALGHQRPTWSSSSPTRPGPTTSPTPPPSTSAATGPSMSTPKAAPSPRSTAPSRSSPTAAAATTCRTCPGPPPTSPSRSSRRGRCGATAGWWRSGMSRSAPPQPAATATPSATWCGFSSTSPTSSRAP